TRPACTASSPLSLHDALPISDRQRGTRAHQSSPNAISTSPIGMVIICLPRLRKVIGLANTRSPPLNHQSSFPVRASSAKKLPLRSEEHTSELQSRFDLVCRLL